MVKSVIKVLNSTPIAPESKIPVTPPMRQINTASIKNCCRMLDCLAPIAMRTPISLVRSVTDTNIIFITPIPPTIKEIKAIEEISNFIVPVVLSIVCLIVSLFMMKKSFLPWRNVSNSVMPFSAAVELISSATFTVIEPIFLLPEMRFITVV